MRRSCSYSLALSMASAARRASSSARARSSRVYWRLDSAVRNAITPSVRPRATSGTMINEVEPSIRATLSSSLCSPNPRIHSSEISGTSNDWPVRSTVAVGSEAMALNGYRSNSFLSRCSLDGSA